MVHKTVITFRRPFPRRKRLLLFVTFKALAERRTREVSDQAASRFRAAQQLEERVRREAGKEASVLREGLSRLEGEVERLRLEGERAASNAQQEIQKLR